MTKILKWNSKILITSLFVMGGFIIGTNVAHAGATLFLSPASGSLKVGESISTTIVVNTGGEAINAVQAIASFPTDLLEATAVTQSGLFTFWPIAPSYSNSTGKVNFAGGLTDPGYNGSSGSILTITFKGKNAGTATVTLGSVSILKNDGNGTDIFTGAGSATFTISNQTTPIKPSPPPEQEEPEEEPPKEALPAPIIYSDTHPKQDKWYTDSSPAFYWDKLEGAEGFSYSFDDNKNTTPDDTVDATDNKISYKNTKDGVWYFHVKVISEGGWSKTYHYRVQIDTTPPLEYEIRMEGENPTKMQEPKIHFSTIDEHSGIDRYELSLDKKPYAVLETGETEPFTFGKLPYGSHSTEVQAIDKAGNTRSSTLDFEIIRFSSESGFWLWSHFILYSWIVLILLIIILALVIILCLFLFLCCRRRKEQEDDNEQKKERHWRKIILQKLKKNKLN